MEVILLERIQKLGELGDKVTVKSGYGRNYLIPNRKAVLATAENVAKLEKQREDLERAQAESVAVAEGRAEKLRGTEVTIKAHAGTEGKLFGSVGTSDIADAIVAAGGEVEKREIRLPEGPLRELGDYEIDVHLHGDIDVKIPVSIVLEETDTSS